MPLPLVCTLALATEPPPVTPAPAVSAQAAAESLLTRDPEGIGFGLLLGAPTGFSAAWRPGGRFLVDAGVAWSFVPTTRGVTSFVQLHVDGAFDLTDMRTAEMPDMHFPLSLGVGPRIRLGGGTGYDAFNLALRVPVTMGFWHEAVPVEGFIELAPGVGVFPLTEFILDAALGVRFWLPAPGGGHRYAAADPEVDPY